MITYKQAWSLQNNRLTDLIMLFGESSPFLAVLSFYLTFRCNYRCVMCSAQEQIQKVNADCDVELLIRKLSHTRFRLCKPFIKITGGEPLLHPRFIDFISFLKIHKFRCSINTNGYLLSKYNSDIVRHKVDVLNVTVLGPEGIYEKVNSCPGSFRIVYNNLRQLIYLKKQYKAPGIKIIINIPINEINFSHINDTIEQIHKLDIQGITVQHLMFSENTPTGVDRIDTVKLISEIKRVLTRREKFPIRFFPYIPLNQIKEYYTNLNYSFKRNTCIMPWLMMSVDPDGYLNPCLYVTNKIGCLRDEDSNLLDFWNNSKFRSFRSNIKKYGLMDNCKRCCIRKY